MPTSRRAILNLLKYFYGINGIDRSEPYVALNAVKDAGGRIDNTLSFLRPIGIDASYTPYVSSDLIEWSRAPTVINSITAEPGTGLERVVLESVGLAEDSQLFYRIQLSFYPDNFENGLIPDTFTDKLLQRSGNLYRYDTWTTFENITYKLVPDRVLFFRVVGSSIQNAGTLFGGTATDGETRDFVYRDRSPLGVAAVHASLLEVGEEGLMKVTLVAPKRPLIGSAHLIKGNPFGDTQASEDFDGQIDPFEKYSYRIEVVRLYPRWCFPLIPFVHRPKQAGGAQFVQGGPLPGSGK